MNGTKKTAAILLAGVVALQLAAQHAAAAAAPAPLPGIEPVALTVSQASGSAVASTATRLYPNDFTLYVYRNGFLMCRLKDPVAVKETFAAAVNASTVKEPSPDPQAKSEGDFMVVFPEKGFEKHQYSIKGGCLYIDGVAYRMSAANYAALAALFDAPVESYHAQWLAYMNPERITGARYLTQDSGGKVLAAAESRARELGKRLRNMAVVPDSGESSPYVNQKITPAAGTFRLWLDFDGGTGKEGELYYMLTFQGEKLTVESSDIGYSCVYTLADPRDGRYFEKLVGAPQDYVDQMEAPIETAKPVIYLYPTKTTDVSVKLDFQGRLGYTFPAYNGGWNVTASPDGTLVDQADGSTHYYLFWDGIPDRTSWDFSRGFVVKGEDTEGFLREKLPAMGLLPKEYNDFITYWTPEMRGNAYNLIAFSTAEYEETAPLAVTPAPDTVLRVHMVYRPLSEPVTVEEQILPAAPARSGFTLVEWGGTRVR